MEEQILINITEKVDSFLFLINSTVAKKAAVTVKKEKEQAFIDGLKELINRYNAE
jgi:hypothetical protein